MKFASSILLLTALSASVFASHDHDHDHDDDDDNTVTVTKTVTVTRTDYITRSTFKTTASSSAWSTTTSTLSSDDSSPTGDSDGSCIARGFRPSKQTVSTILTNNMLSIDYHACTPSDTCCDNFQCVGYTQWNSGTCVNR
ncbi:uncharacterized protein N7484_002105 [Penicillium longicatenatum]|uniref:uncharacterized protein n=1 Tax=Penicillium longicatenatum TaxID=1561947 RepID=UPI002546EC7E|nr:uncharacterized protein N7484_002105 [Penicillium longicatenatum]KAJ5658456.1 hypothetical protein N7484_002105 [Penicillium longicatenatum]